MQVKTISVNYTRKFNMGNYNSAEMGVTLWADLDLDEDHLEAARDLFEQARELVKEQALPLLQTDRRLAAEATKLVTGKPVEEK